MSDGSDVSFVEVEQVGFLQRHIGGGRLSARFVLVDRAILTPIANPMMHKASAFLIS